MVGSSKVCDPRLWIRGYRRRFPVPFSALQSFHTVHAHPVEESALLSHLSRYHCRIFWLLRYWLSCIISKILNYAIVCIDKLQAAHFLSQFHYWELWTLFVCYFFVQSLKVNIVKVLWWISSRLDCTLLVFFKWCGQSVLRYLTKQDDCCDRLVNHGNWKAKNAAHER